MKKEGTNMNEKEKYLFEERVPDTDEKRKSTFSMKIGGTVYDVTTHLKNRRQAYRAESVQSVIAGKSVSVISTFEIIHGAQ